MICTFALICTFFDTLQLWGGKTSFFFCKNLVAFQIHSFFFISSGFLCVTELPIQLWKLKSEREFDFPLCLTKSGRTSPPPHPIHPNSFQWSRLFLTWQNYLQFKILLFFIHLFLHVDIVFTLFLPISPHFFLNVFLIVSPAADSATRFSFCLHLASRSRSLVSPAWRKAHGAENSSVFASAQLSRSATGRR